MLYQCLVHLVYIYITKTNVSINMVELVLDVNVVAVKITFKEV